jgi:hypothetical protein
VPAWVSLLLTELAIVTDRPSRTQAVLSPRTSRGWNGGQRRRSSRAGIVLRSAAALSIVQQTASAAKLAGQVTAPSLAGQYARSCRIPLTDTVHLFGAREALQADSAR